MDKIDFKKELKHLYNPSSREFSTVEVPEMQFLMVDGHGDPNTAQAVGRIPVEDPNLEGIVIEECRTGYSMKDRLLRPAQVRVGYHE